MLLLSVFKDFVTHLSSPTHSNSSSSSSAALIIGPHVSTNSLRQWTICQISQSTSNAWNTVSPRVIDCSPSSKHSVDNAFGSRKCSIPIVPHWVPFVDCFYNGRLVEFKSPDSVLYALKTQVLSMSILKVHRRRVASLTNTEWDVRDRDKGRIGGLESMEPSLSPRWHLR